MSGEHLVLGLVLIVFVALVVTLRGKPVQW